jgi:hypothetical protein
MFLCGFSGLSGLLRLLDVSRSRGVKNPKLEDFYIRVKGTVAPLYRRLKVVWINAGESGEVPLVVYRFWTSSVRL